MKWIGFDKSDPEQRKFEFDDSVVLTSDPPQYSVRLLDTNDVTSVLCSNVFKLKPVKPFKRTQQQNNKQKSPPPEMMIPMEEPKLDGFDDDMKNSILDELKPKWDNDITAPTIQTISMDNDVGHKTVKTEEKETGISIDMKLLKEGINKLDTNHKYEYKTLLVDLEHIETFEETLNKLGEERWEMIDFSITQSILPNKSRLFCIMKRNK